MRPRRLIEGVFTAFITISMKHRTMCTVHTAHIYQLCGKILISISYLRNRSHFPSYPGIGVLYFPVSHGQRLYPTQTA